MKSRVSNVLQLYREYFSSHAYQDTPILTAYVNVDPTDPDNRRERPAWLIQLKNEGKRLEAQLDQEDLKRRATRRRWDHVENTLIGHLEERKPEGRSVVFFSDFDDFIAVDLPVPVETRLYFGLPQIKNLLFALDQYKKYLTVLLSGADARMVEVFLTRTTDEVRVETDHELARRFGRKSTSLAKERRDAEYEARFVREVAAELNRQFMSDPDHERMVLGGNQKQAHAVNNELHPAVRDSVAAIAPLDFKLPDSEVAARVKDLADRFELEHDLSVVDDLVARANRGGTAVLERQAVEQALTRGNVKTLVVPFPIASDDFDALIVDATIGGAGIEFVYGEAAEALAKYGGIGALLYYSP